MSDRLERVSLAVLSTATLAIAVVMVHRELKPSAASRSVAVSLSPDFVKEWSSIARSGIRFGNAAAPVTLIEFVDLECPVCRRFHTTVGIARHTFGDSLSVVMVHFPLAMHRFSRAAARAAECADARGRLSQFVDEVFAKQDSIGLKSWGSYAVEAGVRDTVKFQTCASETGRLERVEAGLSAGRRIGVTGTPTVIINGWRFQGAIAGAELERVVRSVLHGEAPFPNKSA